jgi:hypothetical protein
MRYVLKVLSFILCVFLSVSSIAKETEKKSSTATRTTHQIKIDGVLQEPAWALTEMAAD